MAEYRILGRANQNSDSNAPNGYRIIGRAKQPEIQTQSTQTYEPQGFGAIGRDIAESAISFPGAALKGIVELPSAIGRGYNFSSQNKLKALAELPLGALEGLAGLATAPRAAMDYLQKRGLANPNPIIQFPDVYGALKRHEQKIGLSPTEEGQAESRAIGQLMLGALGSRIPSRAGRIGALTGVVAGEGGDPIHAALGGFLGEKAIDLVRRSPQMREKSQEIPKAEEAAQQTAQTHQYNENELNLLKQHIEKQFGTKNINKLENKKEQTQKQIQALEETQKTIEPLEPQYKESFERNKDIIPELTKSIAQTEKKLQTHLMHQKEPDVIASKNIVSDFEKQYKEPASQLYKDIENDIKPYNIEVPNDLNPKGVVTDAFDLLETEGWGSVQAASLRKELAALNKAQEIPALEFYRTFRNTRQTANATRKAAYGKPAEQFDSLIEKAELLDNTADRMAAILEQTNFGAEVLEKLAQANAQWKVVKSVENNSLYKQMLKTGRVKGSISENLRGTEQGLDVLNKLVESNPETLQAVLGHTYAGKPSKLLNASERELRLAEQSPQLQTEIKTLKDLVDRLNFEKEAAPKIKQERERQQNIKQINEYQETLKQIDNAIVKLKDAMSKEGLSKQKKEAYAQKLLELQQQKEKLHGKIKKFALNVFSVMSGTELSTLIKKLIR